MLMKQSNLLLQLNFLVCKLIIIELDNNVSTVCFHRCSSACLAMIAVTGLMTTDTLYLTVCLFELAFGAVGQV
jgi:hypothetical protein